MPANSARASGSRNRMRARSRAGGRAGTPNRARSSGWRGGRVTGASSIGTRRSHSRASGPNRRRQASASRPSASSIGAEVPLQDDAPAGLQRMGERRLGLDPLKAVPTEVERAEERRGEAQRVDRGARVVDEPRQRELGGAGPAADLVGGFVHPYGPPGPGELDRRGEPVGPRPDDDRVEPVRAHGRVAAASGMPAAIRRRNRRGSSGLGADRGQDRVESRSGPQRPVARYVTRERPLSIGSTS